MSSRAAKIGWLVLALGCLLILAVVNIAVPYWHAAPGIPDPSAVGGPAGPVTKSTDTASAVAGYFRDETAAAGLDFVCRNGEEADKHSLLESLGSGVALIDFDGDGLLDVFLVGGGYFAGENNREIRGAPCKLYKNLGNWRFRDVTAEVGLARDWFYSHGCAVADFDRDGWPDLLVTGYEQIALFHNESDGHGGRRFVEVTHAAGLRDQRWSTSAAFADLDGDGFPDLYVCHYVDWSMKTHRTCHGDHGSVAEEICPPRYFRGTAPTLFRNNGNGTFTEVTDDAGVVSRPADYGMGLGVVAVDLNGDGLPDLYAVNDTMKNLLYLNQSTPGHIRLKEVGRESGAAVGDTGREDGCMGVDAADYDGCGRPSLWVTTFENESPALYHNNCTRDRVAFQYSIRRTGIAELGQSNVGFGTGFLDFDNDGWEDLAFVNGHVRRHPTRNPVRQRPVLLKNDGTGRFSPASLRGGPYFNVSHRGRGLAIGDLDNDGWPDLVVTHQNEPVVLLRNVPSDEVARRHWVGIELQGRGHRDVVGATVLVDVNGTRRVRFAKGGGSYLSSGDRRILVGLGDADAPAEVTVRWPRGSEQRWSSLAGDRYWRLVEGEPSARSPPGGK